MKNDILFVLKHVDKKHLLIWNVVKKLMMKTSCLQSFGIKQGAYISTEFLK